MRAYSISLIIYGIDSFCGETGGAAKHYHVPMMPNLRETPIMDYVYAMQRKVRELEAQRDRIERPVFWWGVAWGLVSGCAIGGYIVAMVLHHGG